jgi:tRNA threonylcarbamoyl adenosine modification protein YeaZ
VGARPRLAWSLVLVLALDTSTPATSVALADAGRVVAHRTEVAPHRHAELLSPLIVQVLRAADLPVSAIEVVAVGVGPGPFTGLRVGVTTALSLADALGVQARGVCSLDAVAFAVDRPWRQGFAVVTDARRKEVYWARYDDGRRVDGPSVDRPSAVAERLGPGTAVVGFATQLYAAEFAGQVIDETAPYPAAAAIARLATGETGWLPVQPLYLRRPDARPPGAPKRVTPP